MPKPPPPEENAQLEDKSAPDAVASDVAEAVKVEQPATGLAGKESEEPPEPVERKIESTELSRCVSLLLEPFSEGPVSWRHVSRISEYPIVRADGRAADLAELWPFLKGDGFQESRIS